MSDINRLQTTCQMPAVDRYAFYKKKKIAFSLNIHIHKKSDRLQVDRSVKFSKPSPPVQTGPPRSPGETSHPPGSPLSPLQSQTPKVAILPSLTNSSPAELLCDVAGAVSDSPHVTERL